MIIETNLCNIHDMMLSFLESCSQPGLIALALCKSDPAQSYIDDAESRLTQGLIETRLRTKT